MNSYVSGLSFSKLIANNALKGLPYLVACVNSRKGSWIGVDGTLVIGLLAQHEHEHVEGVVNVPERSQLSKVASMSDVKHDRLEFFAVYPGMKSTYIGDSTVISDSMHNGDMLNSLMGVNHLDMADPSDIICGFHIAAMLAAGYKLVKNKEMGQTLYDSLVQTSAMGNELAVSAASICIADRCFAVLIGMINLGVDLDCEGEEGLTIAKKIDSLKDEGIKKTLWAAVTDVPQR